MRRQFTFWINVAFDKDNNVLFCVAEVAIYHLPVAKVKVLSY
jgi:hypothetical protein